MPSCRKLLTQVIRRAAIFACVSAGSISEARMPITAITMRSSINVKARPACFASFIGSRRSRDKIRDQMEAHYPGGGQGRWWKQLFQPHKTTAESQECVRGDKPNSRRHGNLRGTR